jgi:lactam utilization protein B
MFKLQLVLRSSDETQKALADLERLLEPADLTEPAKVYLMSQMRATLGQIADQMSTSTVREFRADREFEGEGYSVHIKARAQSYRSVLSALKQLLAR